MRARVLRLDFASRTDRDDRITSDYDGAFFIDMAPPVHGDDQATRDNRVGLFFFCLPVDKDRAANVKCTEQKVSASIYHPRLVFPLFPNDVCEPEPYRSPSS